MTDLRASCSVGVSPVLSPAPSNCRAAGIAAPQAVEIKLLSRFGQHPAADQRANRFDFLSRRCDAFGMFLLGRACMGECCRFELGDDLVMLSRLLAQFRHRFGHGLAVTLERELHRGGPQVPIGYLKCLLADRRPDQAHQAPQELQPFAGGMRIGAFFRRGKFARHLRKLVAREPAQRLACRQLTFDRRHRAPSCSPTLICGMRCHNQQQAAPSSSC